MTLPHASCRDESCTLVIKNLAAFIKLSKNASSSSIKILALAALSAAVPFGRDGVLG